MENTADCTSDLAERDQTKPVADRISALPDDIVVLILSKLILRDAIRTGVLSHRWKHMWEYTTGTLDFYLGYKHEAQSFEFDEKSQWLKLSGIYRGDKARYISAVNKILNAHNGSTIETFNVTYDLDVRNKLDIDSWIDFGLRKKVRSLELIFTQPHPHVYGRDFRAPYEFPLPLLEKSNVSCLTSLILRCVEVTGEVLNYLLSNCPFLESLCVELSSYNDVHLVPCPKLKHLDIRTWSEGLDISSAPNLTTFMYSGSEKTRLSIKNVPNLTHVSLGGPCGRAIVQKSSTLPSFLFQLKKLTLELQAVMIFPKFPKFPELNNVNELKLTCSHEDCYNTKVPDIFSCSSIMEACPNLYRFSVRFDFFWIDEKVRKREKWSIINKCLKVVELEWFRGAEFQFEFYDCLLSSAPSLDKIIVNITEKRDTKEPKIRESVRRLTQKLSPSAELVIYPLVDLELEI